MAESIVKGTAYHHFCNRYSNLTDEIYKIQDEYRHVVISCLSNILYSMVTTNDTDASVRVNMKLNTTIMSYALDCDLSVFNTDQSFSRPVFTKLGNILLEQSEAKQRYFYVMAPTPRTTHNFSEYSKTAMVIY